MEAVVLIVVAALALLAAVTLGKAVRIVPQQRMDVVERFGRYRRTLGPGLNVIMPYVDRIRTKVDMREQVWSSPPQPVITSDNLVVSIDTVLYFRVINPKDATYEIASFLQGIEQLTVTTLRNVIGSMDLEKTLTSRETINRHLQAELDETTGKWGVKVTRVEIKAIEPPPSIRDAMEKQMRAERDRRAAILNAEGVKQSQVLTAEGEKQAAVLRADGDRQARILQAEGQAKAIRTVFDAIHVANPDSKVLAYQYLQALPQIAQGSANKVWVVPAEMTRALEGIGGALGNLGQLAGGGPIEAEQDEAVAAVAEEARIAAEEAAKVAEDVREDVRQAEENVGGGGARGKELPANAQPASAELAGEQRQSEQA
ncbi:SPFH/Band 7/PHB domain protein [Natronosporangium hydrolyticum]|uniref:SPFH/Band 7/PHB domain protein n=1 Tax=Natronosporangium hydrolyticum TaxID=2811111 RepID=A0A895Y5T8_9ACTN|nr:SPFH domain-containing protein [Natronosporangium hydrolyticum]QSB13087.1 SPFH/Band 7/PHB domain protein [Natronosporangium hydrolyticum]